MKQHWRYLLLLALPLLLIKSAQGQTAQLSGLVKDATQAVVPNAQITVIHEATGFKRTATTDEDGYYSMPFLTPGVHKILVQAHGFQTVSRPGLVLSTGQAARIDFVLEVGQVRQTVIVPGHTLSAQGAAAVGTLVAREFIEHLPLKGRSFNALLELAPGIVAGKSYSGEEGQYNVNGQRANANYLMIDGVSANVAVLAVPAPNQPAGVALPLLAPRTGGNELAALDAVQELRVETSGYAPGFGRTPGAQIAVSTRAGTNEWHGGLYDYFRNEALQANNWFANRRGLARPPARLHDFGATLGGPLVKERTFLFLAYEGVRAREPRSASRAVPSLAAREAAPAPLKPLLQAFPLPNGAQLDRDRGELVAPYANPARFDSFSARVDQPLHKSQALFARFNVAPSATEERLGSLNTINATRWRTTTATAGLTGALTPRLTHELRLNWSAAVGAAVLQVDDYGGAAARSFVQSLKPQPQSLYGIYLLDSGSLLAGDNMGNAQRQFNFVDNFSAGSAAHQFRFGLDYRRSVFAFGGQQYRLLTVFNNVGEAVAGRGALLQVSRAGAQLQYVAHNVSAFAQDSWQARERLTLLYGVRWELNPAPAATRGDGLFAVRGVSDPAALAFAGRGAPLWRTAWRNFAPRVGVAYRLGQAPQHETVLRGGFGLYYDTGSGQAVSGASSSYPYRSDRVYTDLAYPFAVETAAFSPTNESTPYGVLSAFDPQLRLPLTWQWNGTVEQALGAGQSLSIAYVGAAGRRLLRQEQWRNSNPEFTTIFVTRNAAASDYRSLQVQFQRRLARGVQAQAAYTWARALDNASDDSSRSLPVNLIDVRKERGAAAFDVRHVLALALTAHLPAPSFNKFTGALLRGWALDALVRARSATPLNVVTGTDVLHAGLTDVARPDVIAGVPLWLVDTNAAGGRRLNRAAFVTPVNRQGALGRNALRGFGFTQLDAALRRQFRLNERWRLQLRAECFNLLNHPNFGDPVNRLNRAQFGLTGYQTGETRTAQVAVKVQF